MKFAALLTVALTLSAAAAAAQQAQMQQLVDQKTADVTTTIGAFRNQIMSDQTQIETLTAQNEALKKHISELEKKEGTVAPPAQAGPPQLGTK